MDIKIAPSILSADFSKLGEEVQMLTEAGADWIHFDVMDGNFVPNLTFGPAMCKAVRPYTDLPIDVHLMVSDPGFWIEPFVNAGADCITIHLESKGDKSAILDKIHGFGKKAGVVINPETPVEETYPYLEKCDLVLLMGVHPGFGGQSFFPETLDKIRALRSRLTSVRPACDIEIDGGINLETGPLCTEAGATILVSGNTVFKSPDPKETIRELRKKKKD